MEPLWGQFAALLAGHESAKRSMLLLHTGPNAVAPAMTASVTECS
jgi:hypothetical protein